MDEIEMVDQPSIIRRQGLKNSDFSIISSNCIGGVFYHNLGLPFDSPTINLSIKADDYLDLITHLKEYFTSENLIEDQNADESYPVGILSRRGGHSIRIFFIHYPDFATAKEKWNERKKRVHYDNLYYIMTDGDEASMESLQKFDALPLKHKVVFTGKNYPNIKAAYWVKNCEKNGRLGDWYFANNYLNKMIIDQFDYVKFLNER